MSKFSIGAVTYFEGYIKNQKTIPTFSTITEDVGRKRSSLWNDYKDIRDCLGIIVEERTIENTIKVELQELYREKCLKPYFWYCFKTRKIYFVFEGEISNNRL